MKTTVFRATSLDGFIARSDGDVSWLGDPSEGGDDGGFSALMERIDDLVIGIRVLTADRRPRAADFGENTSCDC